MYFPWYYRKCSLLDIICGTSYMINLSLIEESFASICVPKNYYWGKEFRSVQCFADLEYNECFFFLYSGKAETVESMFSSGDLRDGSQWKV